MENKKRDFIWNTVGNTANAMLSFLLLIVVTRENGTNDGGIFSFAFANAYIMFIIASFSVRTFQVTDINHKHKTSYYVAFRYLTSILMIVFMLIFVAVNRYSLYKASVVILIGLLKGVDALSDVYQGAMQIHGRLDVAGKCLFYRSAASMAAFIAVITFSHNLILASFISFAANLIICIFYDIRKSSLFDDVLPEFEFKGIHPIFKECLPLFLSNLLWNYIFTAPKYAIDALLDNKSQNYFNIVCMPANVINLFGIFILYPILVDFAKQYDRRDLKGFVKTIVRVLGFLLGITLLLEVCAYFLGIPVLSIIYGLRLDDYKNDLLILLFAGGFGACSNIFNYALTIMRKQNAMLLGNAVCFISAFAISFAIVKKSGLHGAAWANLWIMIMLFAVLLIITSAAIFINFHSTGESKQDNSLAQKTN